MIHLLCLIAFPYSWWREWKDWPITNYSMPKKKFPPSSHCSSFFLLSCPGWLSSTECSHFPCGSEQSCLHQKPSRNHPALSFHLRPSLFPLSSDSRQTWPCSPILSVLWDLALWRLCNICCSNIVDYYYYFYSLNPILFDAWLISLVSKFKLPWNHIVIRFCLSSMWTGWTENRCRKDSLWEKLFRKKKICRASLWLHTLSMLRFFFFTRLTVGSRSC